MSRFGGTSTFGGRSKFGGVRIPTGPDFIIERMLASLDPVATAIKSRARLVGDPQMRETWDRYIAVDGLPAVLVAYNESDFSAATTSGGRLTKLMRFTVYCLAGDYRSRELRLRGLHVYEAGAENLAAWCVYFMTRELQGVDSPSGKALLKNARPVKERELFFESNVAGYQVTFEGEKQPDLYDDLIAITLERLGICHTPTDLANLFESDNVTPKSGDETNASSNVAELE